MPTAIKTFRAPYGDELITVAQGEIVAAGHELVLRFPDNFRLDHGSGRRDARRLPTPAGVPELGYVPRHDVAISESAWRAIDAELDGDIESGGVLIGKRLRDGSFAITDASGPGGDRRGSFWIRHRLDYYARFAHAHAHEGSALGIWHSHPAGTLEPSETDLRSWKVAAEDSPDGCFLGVIVTTPENPAELRMRLRAWTVVDGVCEPAKLSIPERV